MKDCDEADLLEVFEERIDYQNTARTMVKSLISTVSKGIPFPLPESEDEEYLSEFNLDSGDDSESDVKVNKKRPKKR